MIEYSWTISQMEAYPEFEGNQDVVFTVHWRLDGTDGKYSAGVYGSVGLTISSGAVFTPYNELTLDQVVGWVKGTLGEEAVSTYETLVAEQIHNLANPKVVSPPLPWNS